MAGSLVCAEDRMMDAMLKRFQNPHITQDMN
jgi:hypothetical protein